MTNSPYRLGGTEAGNESAINGGPNAASKHYRQRIGDVAETLLEYFESNKTFQVGEIAIVPARNYTDPSRWRAEMDLIFKRLPLMLALSCEVPNPGDYKAMEVVSVPVLIARDKTGTARAFFNVCAHRWAPVAAEGRGNCPRFVCPFHGWTYGADGKLIGIADRAKFGDVDRSTHGLTQLPCEERHGMIFVCLSPGTTLDLEGHYGALLKEFAEFELKDWTFLGSSVLEAPNWKLILTNFFESYHFTTLHSRTVALQFVSNVIHYEVFGPHMRIGFAKHAIAKLREVPRAQWGLREGPAFTFMRYFFPNVIGSMYLSDEISSFGQILPGPTPDRSRFVVLYLRRQPPKDEGDRERIEKELQSFKFSTEIALRDEDFAIGIATQKGLESGAHEGLLYGRNEAGSHYLHAWLNWYLQADLNAPKPML